METYQKMWRYMESSDGKSFVDSYEEGVQRVLSGDYAFLCESTMLDYLIQRNCNLTQIGGLLDDKGYGIATPKGSKWKDRISQAVLYLQEKGVIQMYYDKWWKNHGHQTSEACDTKKTLNQRAMANALGIVNIGGIFVVLLCGLAFAVTVAIVEFCLSSRLARAPGAADASSGAGASAGGHDVEVIDVSGGNVPHFSHPLFFSFSFSPEASLISVRGADDLSRGVLLAEAEGEERVSGRGEPR